MGNFDIRVKRFIDVFINAGAYNKVLLGLKNTIIIAVLGLVIGILI
ncbi:MAG TPA: amino acid ABC transporter permease, partial [Candidatus Fimenecus sp.]|nr:amino acid ABC transporter permease [Candidatus Fimenecus sp.]